MPIEESAHQAKLHWDTVYSKAEPDAVSWYRAHLDTSLRFILGTAGTHAAIIDVGGGHSTLVDDLLELGYRNITVCDVSEVALDRTKLRLGNAAELVKWQAGDILTTDLPERRYDIWHDRAVFHFLANPDQRLAYVQQITRAMKPGGHVVIATFGPQGPLKCSGLQVCRYDADSLAGIFGSRFKLKEALLEMHETPFATTQQFLYCQFEFS